jgi:hypothetical protein
MVTRDGKISSVQLGKEIGSKETVGSTTFKIVSGWTFATLHNPSSVLDEQAMASAAFAAGHRCYEKLQHTTCTS